MNKFRDALYRFMYGRNGVDALNWALVILELAVSILSSIIRVPKNIGKVELTCPKCGKKKVVKT